MGLKAKKVEESLDIAIWNGTEIIFKSSQSMFYTMLKLLTKYKLSVPKLLLSLREANRKIKELYAIEKNQQSCGNFLRRLVLISGIKSPLTRF